jgi:F-type H+-transporting ATPase subunit delta
MSIREAFEVMTKDVGAWHIAQVYAEGLFRAAQRHGQTDEVAENLASLIRDVFPALPDFEKLLSNRSIGRDAKAPVIQKVMEGRATPLFTDFLQVLNRHERLELLRPIAAAYRDLLDEKAGRIRVLVRSATPLPDDQREQLLNRLRENMRREPLAEFEVDPNLLGGMVVNVGDIVYDGSVRTRLQNLRKKLLESSSYEIQTRRDRFSH